jgi:hypothetical protein
VSTNIYLLSGALLGLKTCCAFDGCHSMLKLKWQQ